MKKIKQTLSLILVAIMLMAAVPMQSFAAFDFFYIAVDKLEYAGEVTPISYKAVISQRISEDVEYAFFYDNAYYNITLSDGKLFENKWGIDNYKSIRSIRFIERINIDDCIKAYEQGKKTVNVEVEAFIQYANNKYNSQTFTLERPLVKEFVTDIKFSDTMPEITEENAWNITSAFVGKNFDIVYADGTMKTAAIVDTDEGFLLDGEHIFISDEDGSYIDEVTGEMVYYTGYTVEFIDEKMIIDEQRHSCNYSSIELLDYSFDDNGKLTSVTYCLTYKDGNIIEKTCAFEGVDADCSIVIDTVDGYDITARMYVSPSGIAHKAYGWLTLRCGLTSWALGDDIIFENYSDICDCHCHDSGIWYILTQILYKIQEIFGKEVYCQCGYWHVASF